MFISFFSSEIMSSILATKTAVFPLPAAAESKSDLFFVYMAFS